MILVSSHQKYLHLMYPLSCKNSKGPLKEHSHPPRNYLYRIWNINAGFKIIWLSWVPKNLFIFVCSDSELFVKLYVTDPAMEQIQVTDWFHKLKVTDLNISKRTNNSPFFFNNKSIEKHYTQLILITNHWKVLFYLGQTFIALILKNYIFISFVQEPKF